MEILVQLVQIGGIGGTLAFLLLGYFLLAKEQDKPAPSPAAFDAIYRFLRYALVFFVVGIAAQIGVPLVQDTLRRWSQPEVVQLIFDRWYLDPGHKRAVVSFSEAGFLDVPVVEKRKRNTYDIYVAVRARQSTRPLIGEYPVLLGPFDFSSATNLEKTVTDAQIAAVGNCVQFVLFGVDKGSPPLSEPFNPAALASQPIVFNNVNSCT